MTAHKIWVVVKGLITLATVCVAVYGAAITYDFFKKGWNTVSSPVSVITDAGRTLLGKGERGVTTEARGTAEQRQQAVKDLALIAAYDSLNEPTSSRARAMEEIVKVVVRINRNEGITIPKILEGAVSWLPPGWDPRTEAWVTWRDRERPRMVDDVTKADMDIARPLAEKWFDADPGPGPIRYARVKYSLLDPKRLMAWSDGEARAAKTMHANMRIDERLQKEGLKTSFFLKK